MLGFNESGCSVTVNIPVLGTGDSGFESLHPDNFLEELDMPIWHIQFQDQIL